MILNLTSQTSRSGLYFIYRGSVNMETKGYYGLSHLGEHLFCKIYEDLEDELQKYAIESNAYTSHNEIVFHFTGLDEYLNKFRDILVDRFIKGYEFDEKILDNEKTIVLEEYKGCFTDQVSVFFQNHFRKKYGTYSAIGLKEDIENIKYDDFVEFYNKQYSKPDMIINISKDYKLERENIQFEDRNNKIKSEWKPDPNIVLEKPIKVDDKICVLYEQDIEYDDIPYVMFINSMIGSGLNSPLYQEIREKRQLTYSIQSVLNFIGNKPVNIIFTSIDPNKEKELDTGLNQVFNDKDTISKERFDIIKISKNIKIKDSEIDRYANISDLITPHVKHFREILNDITYDDIVKYYNKYYRLQNFEKYTDID